MNEAETRAELIDPALAAAGWGVVEGSRIRREYLISPGRIEGRGRRGKPLKADYVLEFRNTKLATVEAKAVSETLTEGVGQAKDYAGKLGDHGESGHKDLRRNDGFHGGADSDRPGCRGYGFGRYASLCGQERRGEQGSYGRGSCCQ